MNSTKTHRTPKNHATRQPEAMSTPHHVNSITRPSNTLNPTPHTRSRSPAWNRINSLAHNAPAPPTRNQHHESFYTITEKHPCPTASRHRSALGTRDNYTHLTGKDKIGGLDA